MWINIFLLIKDGCVGKRLHSCFFIMCLCINTLVLILSIVVLL